MDEINPAVCSEVTFLPSGLRGAIAFGLAARDVSTDVRRTIFTTTLLVVCFTIWVLGMAADPMLRHLDIRLVVSTVLSQTYQRDAPSFVVFLTCIRLS